MYSDMKENISVTIRAQFGRVFLSPMPMQLHQPLENILSVSRDGRAGKDLILAGHVEILNYALQLIQYLGYGAQNFILFELTYLDIRGYRCSVQIFIVMERSLYFWFKYPIIEFCIPIYEFFFPAGCLILTYFMSYQ